MNTATTKNENTIETLQDIENTVSQLIAKVATMPEIDSRFVADSGTKVDDVVHTEVLQLLWTVVDKLDTAKEAIPSDHLEVHFCD
jgi:hypothetical protein